MALFSEKKNFLLVIIMCENNDPFSDDDEFDQLIEDALLDESIGNDIDNNTRVNYVPQVRLFPADGPPTEDPSNGPRLALADGSKGERGIEEGPCQRAPLVTTPTDKRRLKSGLRLLGGPTGSLSLTQQYAVTILLKVS